MFNGKMKAVTFSFDDGVTQDKRLIELLDKYNLKCTFNINSGLFGKINTLEKNGFVANQNRFTVDEIAEVYKNHEVAVHTLNHKRLPELTEEEIIEEVNLDKQNLEALIGYEIHGMAYPFGGPDFLEMPAKVIEENTSIKYARATVPCRSFDLQEDLCRFKPTVHHSDWELLFELGEKFVNMQADKPQIYYIWGHSYELDWEDTWDKLEEFFKFISNRDDIFYGTNTEVLLCEH